MKNIINKNSNLYNKFNFYHNEWYYNIYNFNKNTNISNISIVNIVKNLINAYFNNINISNIKYINNNKIKDFVFKYKIPFVNNIGNNLTINNIKNIDIIKYNISNLIYFNILEIKSYSNKIIININIYNREKLNLLKKIRYIKINNITNYNENNLSNKANLLLKHKLHILNDKLYLYKFYTSKLFLNNLKFNSYNLIKIKKLLYKIFNKKVYFNITNIKYFHLSNEILINSLTNKLNENRKSSILLLLRKGLRFAKIAKLHFLLKVNKLNLYCYKEIKETYNNLLEIKNNTNIINNIFKSGVNTHITGLRIEAKGRLTKRLIASRAIKKLKYKGSLNNIYSSINKNSTIDFRGFEKSNISFTKRNSYNLLGSYGIKYWISTY